MRTQGMFAMETPTQNIKMKMRMIRIQEIIVSLIPKFPSFKITNIPTSPMVRQTKVVPTNMIFLRPYLNIKNELSEVPKHLIRAEIIATVSALPRLSFLNKSIAKKAMLYIPVRG